MALTSVYYDGPVTETDRAKNLAGAPEYGVYGPGDFKVTAHPSIPYAVLVKAGRAHGHGVTDTAAIDQVVQCATLASGTRWDLIVVRRNWQPALGGPSTLEAVQAGATAVIPAGRKVGPGVEDDQPLFLVKWQGGTSAPVQFIDLRVWAGNGGLYAKDDMVRTYLTTVGAEVNIGGTVWAYQLGANDVPEWVNVNAIPATVPAAGAGWSFTGRLGRAQTSIGPQVLASFKAVYGGGTFSLPSSGAWVPAFTLTNTGFLPISDAYGYFMLRSGGTGRPLKADCAFTIDPTGAVYVRVLFGQAGTTVVPGDELSFNTVWNA